MPRKVYSIAIIGTGIGAAHLSALTCLQRHFRLEWVCDQAQAIELPASCDARVTSQIETVLNDPNVEIVDLCLPAHLQVPITLQALAAGKHVICENPIADSLVDLARITEVADRTQRRVFPVFQHRYGIAMRILSTLQRQSLLGPLRMATLETQWTRNASAPSQDGTPRDLDDTALSHAIHIHDLLTLIGGPIADVSAALTRSVSPTEPENGPETCAAIWMRTTGGALVTSSVMMGAASDHSQLKFVFENATVESGSAPDHLTEHAWRITARDPKHAQDLKNAEESVLLKPGPHYDRFTGFFAAVAACLDGRGDADPLDDGRRAVELTTALCRSAQTGHRVTLPLT